MNKPMQHLIAKVPRKHARTEPAVPPKHVQHPTIGGNIREELLTNGLIINQRGESVTLVTRISLPSRSE